MSASVPYEVCVVEYYAFDSEDTAGRAMLGLISGKSKVRWLAVKEESDGSRHRVAESDPFRVNTNDLWEEPYPYEADQALKQLSQKLLRDGWEFVGDQALTGNKRNKVFRRRLVPTSTLSNSSSASCSQPDVLHLISLLAELNKAGVLTDEEFIQKKKGLLQRL